MNVPLLLPIILGSWFCAALAIAHSGVLSRAPVPAVPAGILALVVAVTLARKWFGELRRWSHQVDLSVLVLTHSVRFVGLPIYWLGHQGLIAREFAIAAGFGDTLAALSACVIVCLRPSGRWSRSLLLGWNLLALLDLVWVAGTAARLALAGDAAIQSMLRSPLSLLPTFLVPLFLSCHVLIFERLLAARKEHERRPSPCDAEGPA